MTEPLLRVNNLKTYFRTAEGLAHAVDGVSFEMQRDEIFAIVGESGCGKSVTALSIIQLVPQPAGFIAGGEVYYKGQEITRLPEVEKRRIRGNEIAMIFQEPMTSLNPVFTIGYQLLEVIQRHQGIRGKSARDAAIEMLDLVGIPDPVKRFEEYPHQLSGGMKQRVMIAIALSCRPGLLIADEPTTALDVTIQTGILQLIKQLQQEFGMAVLLITHDLGVVSEMADRVAVMYAGKIVETSDWKTLYRNPRHPYTIKLLESLPSRQKRGDVLQTIKGRVPKATQYPDGCRFAERCPSVMSGCDTLLPPLIEIETGHHAACHLYNPNFHSVAAEQDEGREEWKEGRRLTERRKDGRKVTSQVSRFTPHPPTPLSTSLWRGGQGGEARFTQYAPRASQGSPLIQVSNLRVHFPIVKGILKRTVGYVYAVDGVDVTIHKGKTLALVGESGCGKTTLGKAILRLGVPVVGEIRYDGVNLAQLSRSALHPYRRRLQIIFQDPYSSLNPRMMVGNIIQEGMITHGIGSTPKDREIRVRDLMQRVGLSPDMTDRYPHEFSGGQRQRIGIARCLAVNPEFIVCDEATSALDVSVQAQILNLLKELQREFNLTYLFITHNLSV
ncbi:dipeptide ABC transporter ATP-binding protein, partial [Candidatus Poribacteria bacterium]|nr:dipeptide ABC transporter ATP-binding protein [Candidatus Poribacteria bacterium]